MASSRRLPPGSVHHFSTSGGGRGPSDEELSRLDALMAMGRQCLCVRNRQEGHALLLAHAMDAAEADIGLLFEVASSGRGHLIAAQGLTQLSALCERLRYKELPLDLELSLLFREKLGLPQKTRSFEAPLIGRDGPCGVLVLFWLEAPVPDGEVACPGIEKGAFEAPLLSARSAASASDERLRREDPYLERVADQCAQSLEHLRISWNLEQALERIEASKRRERERLAFFSAVAHELRSPLNALLGGLQIFDGIGGQAAPPSNDVAAASQPAQARGRRERALSAAGKRGAASPDLSQATRRAGKVVQVAARRLSRLIDDLSTLARLGMGRMSLRKERCELTGLLSLSLDEIGRELEGAPIQLRVDFGNAPLFVEADGERVAQIFDNLLSNALRYTPRGFIEVRARLEGSEALVCVQDSGVGISADRLDALFEPFWSERARFDGRQGGMGVGLSIAHQLAVGQGGSLEVRSEGEGKGSRFEVRLPLWGASRGG